MRYFKIIFLLCTSLVFCACDDAEVFTETLPVITFRNDTVHVYENTSSVKIPLNLSVPAVRDLVLRVGVKAENNVKENTDYAITSKNITVTKGSKEAVIEFTVKDDQIVNQMRWAEMQILPESSYALQKDENTCRIIILDDESDALISFGETETTGWENDGVLKIPVDIEGTLHNDVKIKLELKSGAPDAGEKYFDLPAEVTIPAGETSYEIAIPVTNDNVVNDDRTFVIKMAGVDKGVINTEKSTCVITVKNEDAEVSFKENHYYGWRENSTSIHIPFTVKGYMGEKAEIKLQVVSGDAVENKDYRLKSSEVIINHETMSGEVIVELLGDDIADNHSFELKIMEVVAGKILIGEYNTSTITITGTNDPYRKLLGKWKFISDAPMNMNGDCFVTISAGTNGEDFYKRLVCTTEPGALSSFYNVGLNWYMNYEVSTGAILFEMGKKINTNNFQWDNKNTEVKWNYYGDLNTSFIETSLEDGVINLNAGDNYLCLMYFLVSDGSNPGQDAWFQGNIKLVKQQ